MTCLSLRRYLIFAAVFGILASTAPAPAQNSSSSNPDLPRMQADELVKAMQSVSGQKPVVLYVGPAILYGQGHIRGAELAGPAGRPEGMEKLKARAASLAHDHVVVIYCGCCPYDHCPNIKPAYDELRKLGFSKVRVLYLPTSFTSHLHHQAPILKRHSFPSLIWMAIRSTPPPTTVRCWW